MRRRQAFFPFWSPVTEAFALVFRMFRGTTLELQSTAATCVLGCSKTPQHSLVVVLALQESPS